MMMVGHNMVLSSTSSCYTPKVTSISNTYMNTPAGTSELPRTLSTHSSRKTSNTSGFPNVFKPQAQSTVYPFAQSWSA
jgi:hypothetical protein